jgi:hypothetical protein
MSNIFAAEPLIIARIAANVSGLEEVGSVSKLAGYRPDQIPLRSVYVMPGPSEVQGDPDDGASQVVYPTWRVVVCVEHIEDTVTDDSDTTTREAGEILYQVIRSLVGWRPAPGLLPMAYRGLEEPHYEPGYAEFPALFSTGLVITGI